VLVLDDSATARHAKDVVHEDAIKVGEATKAPDYCFRIGGTRKFFLEAKRPSVDIYGLTDAEIKIVEQAAGGGRCSECSKVAIFLGRRGPPLYKTGTRHVRDTYQPCTRLAQDSVLRINSAYEVRWGRISRQEGHYQLPIANRAATGARVRSWSPRVVALDASAPVRHICLTMKTATVRDLRNRFPRIAEWIEQGQPVEITRAGKVFARLVPAPPPKPRRFRMPDMMARLKQTYGEVSYDAADLASGLEASRGERS
jgi:antitoxin (DNA-binding transcriptional repressor) of toxin-antitoxin stability system